MGVTRRGLVAGGLAAAPAAAGLAMPAIAQGLPAVTWRLVSSFPKSIDNIYGAGVLLAKRVGELTDGRFRIETFAPGEIVPALQVLDAVQNGTVEAGHTGSYYYVGKDEAFAFGTAVPFGLNTRQQNAWLHQGGGNALLNEFYAAYNIHAIPAGNTGAQMGGFFRREIATVADLQGLKFRIGGLGGRVLAKLGVVPQQIAAGDTYAALERGTLDAAEFVGPYDDEKLGLNKVAKYYYAPGWWDGCATIHAFVNREKWAALPEAYRSAFNAAAAEADVWMTTRYDALNPAALRRLVGGGVQIRTFPREVLEASYKAAFELYDEIGARNANWRRLYEPWRAFRAEEILWFRIAEGSFDNFVGSQPGR